MAVTRIKTKGMEFAERDLEVFQVVLRVMVYYFAKDKKFYAGKWRAFFNEVLPDAQYQHKNFKPQVYAVKDAIKYLVEEGLCEEYVQEGKNGNYSLHKLKKEKAKEIINIIENNPKDYDSDLLQDIATYYLNQEQDRPAGKFESSRQAFDTLFKK